MNYEEERYEYPYSIQDQVNQWVYHVGAEHPEREWILTDFDTWHKNPHYVGLPGPHPEDEYVPGEMVTLRCGHLVEIQPDGGEGVCPCIELRDEFSCEVGLRDYEWDDYDYAI